jgi:general secretion pathway protein I
MKQILAKTDYFQLGHRQAGFTLLEVMIALVILVISLTAVFMASTQSVRNISYIETKTFSNWLAMNTLTQLQAGLIAIPQDLRAISGEANLFGKNWTWDAHFQPLFNGHVLNVSIAVHAGATASHLEGFLNVNTP